MQKLKDAWGKISERYYSSLLVRLGIPTLLVGIILGVPAFGAAYHLGLFTNPAYWQGLGFVVVFIVLGAGSICWGWFLDPVVERPNRSNQDWNREL